MAAMTSPMMAFPCPQGWQTVVFVPVQMQTVATAAATEPVASKKGAALPAHVQKQFRKTRMCHLFAKGNCTAGTACRFAHSEDELSSAPDLHKTKLCFNFFRGDCFDKNCNFAHGYEELRTTNGIFKTELCHGWAQGNCRFGSACRFAHGKSELRGAAVVQALEPLVAPAPTMKPVRAKTDSISDETASQASGSTAPTRARWSDMADVDDELEAWEQKAESDSRSTRSGDSDDLASDMESVVSVCTATTLRLAHLPTSFGRTQLVELLRAEGLIDFDFVYLPSDFKRPGSCFGYSFVNWSTHEAALKGLAQLQERYEASWANTQGLEAHIERFRNSPVMHPKVCDEARPALYFRGSRVAFPAPTKRISAPRVKNV